MATSTDILLTDISNDTFVLVVIGIIIVALLSIDLLRRFFRFDDRRL